MPIYQLEDIAPEIHEDAWVADTATVIGRVRMAAGSSLWYGAVARGDNDWISLGPNVNVQDGSVLHCDAGIPLTLEAGVSVGHQVMLHGCHVGENSLIGIQAVVLNRARIGRNCLVAAGSLVPEGKEYPDGSFIMGAPARAIKPVSEEHIAMFRRIAEHYLEQTRRHRQQLRRIA